MKRSATALVPLAAIVLALAALPACGTSSRPSPSPSPESGVRGTAKTAGGPTDDGTTNVWPSSNVTVVVHKGEIDGPVVAQAVADQGGWFSIDLSPGTYTLHTLVHARETVTVRPGEYAHVTLWQSVP